MTSIRREVVTKDEERETVKRRAREDEKESETQKEKTASLFRDIYTQFWSGLGGSL